MDKDKTQGQDESRLDTEELRKYYDMGMRDIELMRKFGATRAEITKWRKENGLLANRIVVWNEELALQLHKDGATDREIAAELGKAGGDISISAIASWRRQKGLAANPKNKSKAKGKSEAPAALERDEADPPSNLQPAAKGSAMPASVDSKKPSPKSAPKKSSKPTPEESEKPSEEPKQDETEKPATPDIPGATRRGHLVAMPSPVDNSTEEAAATPGLRRVNRAKRKRDAIPLASRFEPPGGPFDDFFGDLEAGEPAEGMEDEDAIFMFATILHLCRMDYGWDDFELDEFLDAVMLAESVMNEIQEASPMLMGADIVEFPPQDDGPVPLNGRPDSKQKGAKKPKGGKKKK